MTDRTDAGGQRLTSIEVAPDVDRGRCALCGAPHECVMARPAAPGAGDDEPCWCVGRRFPVALTRAATARDGGAACICRACLDAAETTGAGAPGEASVAQAAAADEPGDA